MVVMGQRAGARSVGGEVACFKLDESGKVFGLNRAGAKMLGLESAADAIGKDFVGDLVAEGGRENVSDAIGKALGGEGVDGVSVPLSVGDGTSKWLDGGVEQLKSASGDVTGTMVTGRDSSASDEAQRKAAEKDVLAALDKMDICAWLTNKEGTVDRCNATACSLLGREESQMLGADLAGGLVYEDDRDTARKCVSEALSGEESVLTILI